MKQQRTKDYLWQKVLTQPTLQKNELQKNELWLVLSMTSGGSKKR